MKTRSERPGMTLLEVLIAMAILAMLLSMVYTVLISTLSARDLIESETHVDRIAGKLMGLISRDIQAAYLYSLEGDYFVGKENRVDFICNTDSFFAAQGVKSDLCEVGYFLRANPKERGAYKLMRREDYFIDDKPLAGGYAIKLYDRVANLKLEYVSSKGLSKSKWSSKENKGLPYAVRITLALRAAPRGAAPEVLKKNIRYFSSCIPVLVSSAPPNIAKEQDEEKAKQEKEKEKDKDKDKDKENN